MPEPKTSADGSNEDEDEQPDAPAGLEGDALDLDGLKIRGDVKGLLTLAKAYRSGAAPGGRDMKRCYAAYQAAAALGSPDAEFAVALFCMSGGIVNQDLKEGATRLRAAAEKGSVPAKVYLGNLYELGIHYKADPEKADVWYRNAARGARIEEEAGSDEYALALAELGCVRYVLLITEAGKAKDEEEKTRLLQRARAHGYGLRQKDDAASDRPTFLDALSGVDAQAKSIVPTAPGAKPSERTAATTNADAKRGEVTAARESKPEKPEKPEKPLKPAKPAGPSRTSIALGAFGYAMLFVITGIGAGYAATLGAHELIAHGKMLPGLGAKVELVFPIVLAVIGILPTALVYRFGTVIKAAVIGGSFGGIGWVAWGTGLAAFHSSRPLQALTFGLAGFVAGLLVLGLLGGTKKQPPRVPKRAARLE